MTEKNGLAQVLDKIVEAMSKPREGGVKSEKGEVANILPKPDSQDIGDGLIIWHWKTKDVTVESVLVTKENNPVKLPKGTYLVNLQMPQTDNCAYSLLGESAKEIGQAILSAYNWQNIWKLHAGDFLLEKLSQESEPPVKLETCAPAEPLVVETVDVEPTSTVDDYPIGNVQG